MKKFLFVFFVTAITMAMVSCVESKKSVVAEEIVVDSVAVEAAIQ